MLEILALIILVFGLNIPLFWIPIHIYPQFFRKLGIFTYLMPLITTSLLSLTVFNFRDYILMYTFEFPSFLNLIGLVFFLFGIILHIWTAKLLSLWGLIGIPEIFPKKNSKFITSGPFFVIRHPTYLAHSLIFIGVFIWTEFIILGILAILDFLIVNTLVIPFEEKELLRRFGNIYKEYKDRVKWRILPGLL